MTMSRGEMPETNEVALVDWNRVIHVVIAGATRRAESSRQPTCLESTIATALANAVALASAACSRGADREPELADVDLEKVISLVARQTVATVLDDAILLLREVLRRCVERGDASVYAVGEDEEGDEAVRLSLGNTRHRGMFPQSRSAAAPSRDSRRDARRHGGGADALAGGARALGGPPFRGTRGRIPASAIPRGKGPPERGPECPRLPLEWAEGRS
jgi:hypothetical protein